jgi:hypothetical protein
MAIRPSPKLKSYRTGGNGNVDPLSDGTDTGAYATIRNNPRPMRRRKLFH